jgi:hypothetical protein
MIEYRLCQQYISVTDSKGVEISQRNASLVLQKRVKGKWVTVRKGREKVTEQNYESL